MVKMLKKEANLHCKLRINVGVSRNGRNSEEKMLPDEGKARSSESISSAR